MIDSEEVTRRTNDLLVSQFEVGAEVLRPEANLFIDVGLDSLDMVDLVAALEREFGMTIDRQKDEEPLRSIRRLADVYAFIERKLAGNTGE